jgi:hypothetical protein
MSDSNSGVVFGGVGVCDILLVVFIVLKLVGSITWSWWWVLSPLWIPVLVIFAIAIIVGIVWGIIAIFNP